MVVEPSWPPGTVNVRKPSATATLLASNSWAIGLLPIICEAAERPVGRVLPAKENVVVEANCEVVSLLTFRWWGRAAAEAKDEATKGKLSMEGSISSFETILEMRQSYGTMVVNDEGETVC